MRQKDMPQEGNERLIIRKKLKGYGRAFYQRNREKRKAYSIYRKKIDI